MRLNVIGDKNFIRICRELFEEGGIETLDITYNDDIISYINNYLKPSQIEQMELDDYE